MELYTLDSQLRREDVVDDFESLIWSERFRAIGDFQLVIVSNAKTRQRFTINRHLALNRSHRVMVVESVESNYDDDGRRMLTVKGRSLEKLLDERVYRVNLSGGHRTYLFSNTPGNIARQMFDTVCRPGSAVVAEDAIPFIQPGSILSTGNIPEPSAVIDWEQEPATVYAAIRELCIRYELGFRLTRHYDASELYFDVYTGSNRTTDQTALTPIVFGERLGNIQNTREFSSVQNYKNVAYVWSQGGNSTIYAPGANASTSGFDRRVLLVSTDVPEEYTGTAGNWRLRVGREELRKHRAANLYDGELTPHSGFVYGVDYNLGDLLDFRDEQNNPSYRRVLEQIFIYDQEGERSYPTLGTGQIVEE